jgi:hypothetical protein
MEGPPWETFPEGLRADVEVHLNGLAQIRRSAGRRRRPCKTSTIRTRRLELLAAARMAVRAGIPIENLTSLKAPLHPDISEPILNAYWEENGAEPSTYTIDLAAKFVRIARGLGLDEKALERLEDMRSSLEEYRHGGMTEKNLAVIRQVLSGNIWPEVVNLPMELMAEARSLKAGAPVKAAVTAQMAVAIAILTFAPVRLGNLVSIRLDENLTRPGGLDRPYVLVFPRYDVKNWVDLEYPFDEDLTALIDEYVLEFRSALLRGSNDLWLFPGESGGCKEARAFSSQITKRIQKAISLHITVHQFRHSAAAIYLGHNPGHYEAVRRILGHRNIQTTTKFYCGLETMWPNERFGDIVRQQMAFRPEAT